MLVDVPQPFTFSPLSRRPCCCTVWNQSVQTLHLRFSSFSLPSSRRVSTGERQIDVSSVFCFPKSGGSKWPARGFLWLGVARRLFWMSLRISVRSELILLQRRTAATTAAAAATTMDHSCNQCLRFGLFAVAAIEDGEFRCHRDTRDLKGIRLCCFPNA